MTGTATERPRFSEALRAATWPDHESAEASRYLGELVGGRLPLRAYAELVAQQRHVYAVLEAAAERMRHHPVAGPFVADELTRLPALDEDLHHLLGPSWAEQAPPSAATTAYLERLHEVAGTWAGGFVAHHYTRYLADLSGGQVIGRAVRRHYGFGDGPGARFYEFRDIEDPRSFKERYRSRLDAAPWDGEEQDRVIAEIRLAYRHNVAVLTELDAWIPTAPA